MSKNKVLLILGVLLIIAVGGIGGFLLVNSSNKKAEVDSNLDNNYYLPNPTATPISGNSTYEDESGFSFQYPSTLKVTDVTGTDPTLYSVLQVGDVRITITDTKFKTTLEAAGTGAKLTNSTTLGGLKLDQYTTSDSKQIAIAIDKGILYQIEGKADVIISTFSFSGSSQQTTGSSSGSDTVYEEETVE